MAAFSTQPIYGIGTLTVSSAPYYIPNQGLVSGISNWQAALIKNGSDNQIEFQLTGTKNTSIGGGTNEATDPVINGLQIVPVVEFLQPAVNAANAILEYGPLTAGTYMLLHVHGAVNVGGSAPKYTGAWYRLKHSTDSGSPTIVTLNYPEINRFLDGPSASVAYSGRSYQFTHTGGFIQLSFEDITTDYADNTTAVGAVNTGPYLLSGAAYPVGTHAEPVAPIFALINIGALTATTSVVNPVIFKPSYGAIPVNGIPVTMSSTTANTTIYYTMTTAASNSEPADPGLPTVTGGVPAQGTYTYSGVINVTGPTKFKAFARASARTDSAISSVYYYSPSSYLT